jgi:predicted deacylase
MNDNKAFALSSDVDLDAAGKQMGFVQLPHSVHRSAYGWLPMPIASIKNGDGPKVVITAGTHGDEYEGQLIVAKLIREVTADMIQGQLVLVPMTNFPAADAGLRTSPIDEGNLNRKYPGRSDGTMTELIAHYVEEVVLPGSDYYIDLHSGGSSLMYLPSMLVSDCGESENQKKGREIADAFGLPYVLFSDRDAPGYSNMAAARKGAFAVSTELGGSGAVTPEIYAMADQGVRHLLGYLGVLKGGLVPQSAPAEPRIMWVDPAVHYVYATEPGLFEPLVELGDEVEAGQDAARIHFVESPGREPVTLKFSGSGLVVCKRVPAKTHRGDCLFHLAEESHENLIRA